MTPGDVPLDLLARLARPATEDWYVFAPALAAVKELCLTRRAAMTIFWNLGSSADAQDRQYTVDALLDIVRVRPQVIQRELATQLAGDPDHDIAESARRVLQHTATVTPEDHYRAFGQFAM